MNWFVKNFTNLNLYIKVVNNEPIIILLYVDDFFNTGVEGKIQECKNMLAIEFEMKDLGLMYYYLGLKVWHKPREMYLGQGKYIIKILQIFGVMDSKPLTTPMITNLKNLRSSDSSLIDPTSYRNLLISLMYLVNTRVDICFDVNILAQFQSEPCHDHWIVFIHILSYLCCIIHKCLMYDGKEVKFTSFTNLDWGGSETDGRSTIGGCFSLGSITISWMSRKQDPIALSSVKSVYVVACEVGKEFI